MNPAQVINTEIPTVYGEECIIDAIKSLLRGSRVKSHFQWVSTAYRDGNSLAGYIESDYEVDLNETKIVVRWDDQGEGHLPPLEVSGCAIDDEGGEFDWTAIRSEQPTAENVWEYEIG
jgi:hypothetical protein